ncbi:hypothetical protein [Glaciimonas soli]|uniref:Uncharacterized protein n=1 Tax=Glaciimonas soli TaxID=2590999 RepID=A0A843YNA3_9BURK|nr:hypothetical protein [Glaciimonas soli]MQQ99253.1 hypothetical protein [Glaciimonas soli]
MWLESEDWCGFQAALIGISIIQQVINYTNLNSRNTGKKHSYIHLQTRPKSGLFFVQKENMKCPNLRYARDGYFKYYVDIYGAKAIAEQLFKTERTIKDWYEGKKKIPFWVPELLQLRDKECYRELQQMNIRSQKLGIVMPTADILVFRKATIINNGSPKPPVTAEMDYSLDTEDFKLAQR